MRTQTSVDGGMEHGASPREGSSKCDEVALHDRGAWSVGRAHKGYHSSSPVAVSSRVRALRNADASFGG